MPTTLLQAIGEILRPEIIDQKGSAIRLEEADPGSSCAPVTLRKQGPAVVLKLDSHTRPCPRQDCPLSFAANDRIFPLFRTGVEGLTAVCDYIIFYQRKDAEGAPLYVFLCELKSGRAGSARRQIENGRLLTDYIIDMARHHQVVHGASEPVYRGLVFSPKFTVPKGDPKRMPCPYQTYEDRMRDLKFVYHAAGVTCDLSYFCA